MAEILHSKIVGSGEKHLLVFHGLFGQLDNWSTLGKHFGEYFTQQDFDKIVKISQLLLQKPTFDNDSKEFFDEILKN